MGVGGGWVRKCVWEGGVGGGGGRVSRGSCEEVEWRRL